MAAPESSAQLATGISSIKEEYPVHKRNTQYTRRMLSTQEENPAHERRTLGEPWPLAGLWLLLLPGMAGGSGRRAVPGGLAAVDGFPSSRPQFGHPPPLPCAGHHRKLHPSRPSCAPRWDALHGAHRTANKELTRQNSLSVISSGFF